MLLLKASPKILGPDSFDFYKIHKEQIMLILLKFLCIVESNILLPIKLINQVSFSW